ncbi:MAG: heme biosynthesis HemY N-terminal domain-containing protein [Rugosibacter sp.]|nr:heme biosynthesis HemY N-terminal domain-containing protein [Rugosibacter sp.]
MTRILFWLLLLAALATGLALAASYNTGYVLLVLPPWRAELSLNFFLLLFFVVFMLVYLLARLVSHTLALPGAVVAYRQRRRERQADAALFDAWRLLQEGRYGHALKSAEKAWPDHPVPALPALAAWRAAHIMRDPEREPLWAERARASTANGFEVAQLMTEAEFALDERRFEDARAVLQQLAGKGGRHIAALRLLLRAERGLGRWREVAHLARRLEKHKALTVEQAAPLRQQALREMLRGLSAEPDTLMRTWRGFDAHEQSAPPLALEMANALMAGNDCREAQRVIENALAENWDEALVLAYARCPGGDILGRIAQAEKWLKSYPGDAALLLTLGRLCRKQQLWGKAQSYLEASIAIAESREAHLELAHLFDHLEKSALAIRHYRAAALS